MKKLLRAIPVILAILLLLVLFSPAQPRSSDTQTIPLTIADSEENSTLTQPEESEASSLTLLPEEEADSEAQLPEDGSYTSKEDVAQYLILYGHLPDNFVTKAEAEKAGWPGGGLEKYLPGKCIGGDWFGNYEGKLPKAKGRTWTECDINTLGKKSRGAERLIFSNDGLIYYTGNHYDSFELIFGEP